MKNSTILLTATLLGLGLTMLSCDESIDDNSEQQKQLADQMLAATWEITYFIDSEQNETADFAGYSFTFVENGTVTADNGVNTYEGTWSISKDTSDDDDSSDLEFNLYFALTNDFEDLNDDWDVISFTESEVILEDVSGGDGSIDELTFSVEAR